MKFIIQYKNQYIKVKVNEKYFHIGKSLSDMWGKT